MSEYDPLLAEEDSEDLAQVEELFAAASAAYLASPWTWLAWSLLLPAAALATRPAMAMGGARLVGLAWSLAILAGGAIELIGLRRSRPHRTSTPLAGWVLRAQGNLSLVGVVLSLALVAADRPLALPGLWLLLLGHSFYTHGGLAFPPFRVAGLLYQAGGVAALWPWGVDPLPVFAAATAGGNLWLFWSLRRRR
jgi:hypothetical protein